jgi:hypothetical protein
MRTLSIVLLATALSACGLDNFHVELEEETTIPGSPLGAGLDFVPFGGAFADVDLLADSELRDEGVDAGDIDSAKLESLQLEVVAGSSFESWLDDVAFYVEADGLPRVLVAEQHGIGALPDGTIVIDLDVTGVELKPYVSRPMTIATEVEGRPPEQDTTIRARAVMGVDADVSNFLGM